jgi:hypothetical protein
MPAALLQLGQSNYLVGRPSEPGVVRGMAHTSLLAVAQRDVFRPTCAGLLTPDARANFYNL